jgi:hypothetical protein
LDLGSRLPFDEAAQVARGFGLAVSGAELERLSACYGHEVESAISYKLAGQSLQALGEKPKQAEGEPGRVMVLQVDGVRVLGQPDPQTHQCEGIEIKCAVIYPQNSPSQRSRWAGVKEAGECLPLLSGLLREAGVGTHDCLIGVSDGAVWIERLYQTLGITQVIDVFHATQYLEQVMVELGWSDQERLLERGIWLRGEANAEEWINTFCPPDSPGRLHWSAPAKTAIDYLEQRAHRMAYKKFKAKGWPIGSGQVEGMNKHVIGARMKRSGMQWSRPGASRMAALRSEACSPRKMTDFNTLRFTAFPVHQF